MTYKYRLLSDEPVAFVTIHKNAYPGVPLESDIPLSHPLLELIVDDADDEEVAVIEDLKRTKTSAVVPETMLPVSGDDMKEN